MWCLFFKWCMFFYWVCICRMIFSQQIRSVKTVFQIFQITHHQKKPTSSQAFKPNLMFCTHVIYIRSFQCHKTLSREDMEEQKVSRVSPKALSPVSRPVSFQSQPVTWSIRAHSSYREQSPSLVSPEHFGPALFSPSVWECRAKKLTS